MLARPNAAPLMPVFSLTPILLSSSMTSTPPGYGGGMAITDVRGRKGVRRRNTSGAYFFHAAVVSLGATPRTNNFAKETCFQGAFLLNNG